ncbi:MAG: hypothetical protein IKU09_06415, partial [Firmicutes bacterium]|nr:hypothetical protein [Bacillota bacterium]
MDMNYGTDLPTRYVRVAVPSADWLSTSLAYHSVVFQYADTTEEILYVRSGNSINPTELKPGTEWVDSAGNSVTGAVTIGTKTVFSEVPSITLTLDYLEKEDVQITFDRKTETILPDDAIWLDEAGNRVNATIFLSSSRTFYEACQVTLKYLDGTSQTQYVIPGSEILLPAGQNWTDENGNPAAGTVTVQNHAVFTETYPDKKITYIVDIGDSSKNVTVSVAHGGDHEVMEGTWYQGSTVYHGGDVISNITRDITLIGDVYLNLYYDLNFPTYSEMWITYNGTQPTLAGLATQACTDQITPASSTVTLRNVSSREVFTVVNINNGMNRSIYFAGWSVNGDREHLIEPGTTIRWDELYSMLDAGENTITIEGVWEHGYNHTVSFFIRYDSATVDTNGNIIGGDPNNYTKEVFNGHLFADPKSIFDNSVETNWAYAIASETADNSVEIDSKIRSLYGSGIEYKFEDRPQHNAVLYMKSFPDDADVIAQIKEQVQANGKQIYADNGFGEKELIEDLNTLDTNHFTIRWYVFKPDGDAWHLDGKLVKKVGTIHVSKTFGGNSNLVSQVKAATGDKQFHITATNGERIETLYLTDEDVAYNAATDTYTWTISNVNYNEEWTITEHNSDSVLDDAVGLEEWVTVDTYNGTSDSGDGDSTTVVGVTHAADTVNNEWLRADFTNVYHMGNTLLVRKVDGETGKPLAGATFQLEQNGEIMKFAFNEENDTYEWDPENGTVTQLSTSENGYLEVIDNFTYEVGAVTVREIDTPKGYSAAGEAVLNYVGSGDDRTVAITNDVTITRKEKETEYAVYQDGVLTVNNYSDTISVTAKKIWNCGEEYYRDLNVEVQLYADDKLVSSVIPGTSNHTVLLTPANGYRYTWEGLPAYANGSKIDWSIKETAVGNASSGYETSDSKGVFPNWIASYTAPMYGIDGNGSETVLLQVHNDVKRTMLRLTKYNGSKSQLLAGAEFELAAVDANGTPIS